MRTEEIILPKNPKVGGQILALHGERVVLLGETLDDALNMDTWDLVADTTATLTAEQEAERRARFEDWERWVRENPPKRVG